MPYIVSDYIHEPLYVVTAIFNPERWKSRYKLYERFAAHVKASGGVLVTVESAYGERHHGLDAGMTQYETPIHQAAPVKPTEFHKARTLNEHEYIRVRTSHELWLKENLLNIGISRLPHDWKYVAWIDADVHFARPNWVGETIHMLQHYKLVQMFSEVQDLGPRYYSIQPHRGFMHCHCHGAPPPPPGHPHYYGWPKKPRGPIMWHPGFAWAARREAIDALGGLIDFAILGAADNHMAHALVGRVDESMHPKVHPRYRERLREWQYRCDQHIRRNVGYVSGLILHYWHGRKKERQYWDRWRILVENQFNPDLDLKYDWQGVLQLVDRGTDRSRNLRDNLMRYFRQRNEDGIEL